MKYHALVILTEPLSLNAKQTIFKARKAAAKATMTELLSSLVRALFMIQQPAAALEIRIRETIEKTQGRTWWFFAQNYESIL